MFHYENPQKMYLELKEYFARGEIYQKMDYYSKCNPLTPGVHILNTCTKPSLQLKAVRLFKCV